MAYYRPGSEPEELKRRIRTLFEKLDSAYPDKTIIGLHTDHKKWGETVTKLYRELGYPDGKTFLEAYGYHYGFKSSSGGRPKTTDPKAIIQELQNRYPNGSQFETADDLFAANPDFMPKLKTIKNLANATFGMSLGKYLLSIGLINSKTTPRLEKPEKKKKFILCMVSILGLDGFFYFLSDTKSIREGDYVEVGIGVCANPVFGKIEKITICDDESAPCDLSKITTISRKVGVREYSNGMIRSILHANAAVASASIINNSSVVPFSNVIPKRYGFEQSVTWAVIRGLSCEVMKIMEYLQEKDSQIYDITDVIFIEKGIAELFVFGDDVLDVMIRYPNVKMAMFAENEMNGTVELYYSRSGVQEVTDNYEIGVCESRSDSKWTLRHSPVESFQDGGNIVYDFMCRDDWENINYVFTDKAGRNMQLGK